MRKISFSSVGVPLCVAALALLTINCKNSGENEERAGEPGPPGPVVGGEAAEDPSCVDGELRCAVGETCNADTGQCEVPRCDPPCTGGERCDAATRTCVAPDVCEGISCDAGQKCYAYPPDSLPESGERATCIPNCTRNADGDPVECPAERACNPSSGLCECDGGPCEGDVGTACNSNDDCLGSGANRRCLGFFDGGYCTSECRESECPPGSVCVDFGDFLCLDRCASHSDCREGYRCETLQSFDECFTEGKVCIPENKRSECVGPDCVIPGEACEDTEECVENGFCATAWPDGTCIVEGCDPSPEGQACPGTSECVDGIFSNPTCMQACDVQTQECRPNYYCAVSSPRTGGGGCIPRACDHDSDCVGSVVRSCEGEVIRKTPNELCDVVMGICDPPCEDDFDCGATCLDVTSEDCDLEREGPGQARRCNRETQRCFTACDTDEVCGVHGYCDFATGLCTAACEVDSECPPGNTCSSDGRCKPPCTLDAECAEGQFCDRGTGECIDPCQDDRDCPEGLECRRRTERCVRPLDEVPVGKACNSKSDCRDDAGGDCLRNRDGFPGGYCTARDCSDFEECPREAECRLADLPGGDGLAAACFVSCERRLDCRDDYSCNQGVCQPEGTTVVGPQGGGEGGGEAGGEGEGEASGEGEGEGEASGEGEGEGEGEGA